MTIQSFVAPNPLPVYAPILSTLEHRASSINPIGEIVMIRSLIRSEPGQPPNPTALTRCTAEGTGLTFPKALVQCTNLSGTRMSPLDQLRRLEPRTEHKQAARNREHRASRPADNGALPSAVGDVATQENNEDAAPVPHASELRLKPPLAAPSLQTGDAPPMYVGDRSSDAECFDTHSIVGADEATPGISTTYRPTTMCLSLDAYPHTTPKPFVKPDQVATAISRRVTMRPQLPESEIISPEVQPINPEAEAVSDEHGGESTEQDVQVDEEVSGETEDGQEGPQQATFSITEATALDEDDGSQANHGAAPKFNAEALHERADRCVDDDRPAPGWSWAHDFIDSDVPMFSNRDDLQTANSNLDTRDHQHPKRRNRPQRSGLAISRGKVPCGTVLRRSMISIDTQRKTIPARTKPPNRPEISAMDIVKHSGFDTSRYLGIKANNWLITKPPL